MKKPIIGICTRNMNKEILPSVGSSIYYSQAVIQAGGIPVLIPLHLLQEDMPQILNVVDGVIFTGGGDIDLRFYEGEESTTIDLVDVERDKFELAFAKQVIDKKIPVLGICRGLQVINIALGGTLYTDIPSQIDEHLSHSYIENEPFDMIAHVIEIDEDSALFQIVEKKELAVNSLHHQCIKNLAPSLRQTAVAADGVIEAAEVRDYPFGILVQWHPECLPASEDTQKIFNAFISATILGTYG